jgi:ABC-2 type transport system permease protein
VFSQAQSVGGWSFDEAIAILGVFLIVDGFSAVVLKPNFGRLPDYIRLGNLDYMLVMPIGSHFHVAMRHLNLWDGPNVLTGLGLVCYSMFVTGHAHFVDIVIFCLMLSAALGITFALWSIIYTTSFWFVRVSNLEVMLRSLIDVGRFPLTALPTWLRIMFTTAIPIAFITNVPAAAVTGHLQLATGIASLFVAFLLLGASHVFWRFAIASYTSASS